MELKDLYNVATAVVCMYGQKTRPLQEFELLLYEQACRLLEANFRQYREALEGYKNGSEESPGDSS